MFWRTRCRRLAFRLVRKSDVAGAFNYVEGEIELKEPSGDRYYTLDVLLNYQRERERALLALDEARWLERPQPEYLTIKHLPYGDWTGWRSLQF